MYSYIFEGKDTKEIQITLKLDDTYSKMILLDLESIFTELLKTLIDNYDGSIEHRRNYEDVYYVFKDIKLTLNEEKGDAQNEYHENR